MQLFFSSLAKRPMDQWGSVQHNVKYKESGELA